MAVRSPRSRGAKPTAVPSSLRLGETLDMMAAAPLAAALLQHRGSDLLLDASAVQRLGGQCLQVLLAACDTWRLDGRTLRVVTQSRDFTDAVVLLGAGPTDLLQAAT